MFASIIKPNASTQVITSIGKNPTTGYPIAYISGSGGWLANKPAAYTLYSEINFSQLVPSGSPTERDITSGDGWRLIYDDLGYPSGGYGVSHAPTSNFAPVVDSTEPASPSTAWRLTMRSGTYADGHGHGNILRPISGNPTKLYCCYSIKYDSDFIWHDISNKHLNIEVTGGQWLVQAYESTAPGMWWRVHDYVTDTAYTPSINTAISLGDWHIIEMQLELSSPGTIKLWIDGVLRTNTTNSNLGNSFTTFGLYGHRGGGGEDVSAFSHDIGYTLGHIYLATSS